MANYVIVGNGVAGTSAAESIRKRDKDGKIVLFSYEEVPFYYRVRLIDFMAGEVDAGGIALRKEQWYGENNIDLKLSTTVVSGDAEKQVVQTADGGSYPYDSLLLATGSSSFVPPMDGADKKGVFTIRTLQDARDVMKYAETSKKLVLIGGGLLGLESGNSLRKKFGFQPMVVEFFPRLLPRQLDVDGAALLQKIMEGMGFSFRLGAKTKRITGEGRVTGVELESGELLEADMVIISAGVRPNLDLARKMGLETDKGIKVDDSMRTSRPGIYAAGDAAEHKGIPYGIWPAAMEQGKVAGANMAGDALTYGGTVMANVLKVVGVDLAAAGDIDAEKKRPSKVASDGSGYKKIVLDNDKVVGAILLGETSRYNEIKKLIESGEAVKDPEGLLR